MPHLIFLNDYSIFVSVVSLILSLFVVWHTTLRKGKLICLRPLSVVVSRNDEGGPSLAFCQLFITSSGGKVGWYVESLYLTVTRSTVKQVFDIWVHGKKNDLIRASGAKVDSDGYVTDHHFLLSSAIENFQFQAGVYRLELFAKLWGKKKHVAVFSITINLDQEHAKILTKKGNSIIFDWSETEQRYEGFVASDSAIHQSSRNMTAGIEIITE